MIKYFLKNKEWELTKGSSYASGYDLRADIGDQRIINPGERWLVSTGLFLEMPIGVEGQIRSRSGLSINHGIIVLNAPGTIDADYRGEVKVSLINLGQQPYTMIPGERIAQLVFAPIMEIFANTHMRERVIDPKHEWIPQRIYDKLEFSDTQRGSGGHGSTGR